MVYLAHDLKHDRDVALKALRPELAAILGQERFLREITLTAQLDHPDILTLIDSGEADGLLSYVLPPRGGPYGFGAFRLTSAAISRMSPTRLVCCHPWPFSGRP